MAADLVLLAPPDGRAGGLADVPDPAVAQAMLGDGIAIDPTAGVLRVFCDGTISSLHASHHALSLTTPDGVEILLHLGLDTEALGGDGFEALVEAGQAERAGEVLIRFDLDRLARSARSLVSPMVVTQAAGHAIVSRRAEGLVAARDAVLT